MDEFLEGFSVRPIPPTLSTNLLDINLIYPVKQNGVPGMAQTIIEVKKSSALKTNISTAQVNFNKDGISTLDPNWKVNSQWDSYSSVGKPLGIKNEKILPECDAYSFWKQCEKEIYDTIYIAAKSSYLVLMGIDKTVVKSSGMYAAIGPKQSTLKATGKYVFEMVFNPSNLLKVALDFYFYYREYFKTFKDAFIYTYAFIFIHETLHLSMDHFTTKNKDLQDLQAEGGGGHMTINKLADMTINLRTAKRLSYLTKSVALRPIGFYTTKTEFHGNASSNFFKFSDLSSLLSKIFGFSFSFSSVPSNLGAYEINPTDWINMELTISPDLVDDFFNSSSTSFLSFAKNIRDFFLINPEVGSLSYAQKKEKEIKISLEDLEPAETCVGEILYSAKAGKALGDLSEENLGRIISICSVLSSERGKLVGNTDPQKIEDYGDLLYQQIDKLNKFLVGLFPSPEISLETS